MNEDEMRIMLARIEYLSAEAAKWKEVADRNMRNGAQLMQARQERDGRVRELREAEDKIAEWLSYSESLTRLIPKARRKDIPPLPKPLDTDIPF